MRSSLSAIRDPQRGFPVVPGRPPASGSRSFPRKAALRAALPAWIAVALLPAQVLRAQEPEPTPEAHSYEMPSDAPGTTVVALVAPLQGGERIGFALLCQQDATPELRIQFGPWPSRPTPLQLAVRRPDGSVWRHGVAEHRSGGPRSGSVSYHLVDPAAIRGFLDAGTRPGALISNGHNSLWNRTRPAASNAARATISTCSGIDLPPLP